MNEHKSKVIELARQGNARAIAAILNRWLQPKGITTVAKREKNRLQLRLEAGRVPHSKILIVFVRKVFSSLDIASIETVQMSLYLTGKSSPVWQEEFEIMPEPVESTAAGASETAIAAVAVAEEDPAQLWKETSGERLLPAEETVTQPEAATRDLTTIPLISSEEANREETAAGVSEKVPELAAIPSESSEEPAGTGKEWEENSPAPIPASGRNAPASWLDTRMGKAIAILPIYLLALTILGIEYLRERSAPAPAAPTPTVSPAPGRK